MSLVAARIFLTLAYSDQFSHPLTTRELYIRTFSAVGVSLRYRGFFATLRQLHSKKKLTYQDGYWSIRTAAELDSLIGLREQRRKLSLRKIEQAQPLVKILKAVPWVKGIAITGSAAVLSADADDDLDFMIITEQNRLWLVRVLVVIIAIAAGKRRTWQHEEPNSWCFNLWLEERQLSVPLLQRSLYTAYEVIQTRWLTSHGDTAVQFYRSNKWIHQFLPNAIRREKKSISGANRPPLLMIVIDILWSPVLDAANWLAYAIQVWYMQRHKTRERVGLSHAFFHPRDTKRSIMTGWHERLASTLSSYNSVTIK